MTEVLELGRCKVTAFKSHILQLQPRCLFHQELDVLPLFQQFRRIHVGGVIIPSHPFKGVAAGADSILRLAVHQCTVDGAMAGMGVE